MKGNLSCSTLLMCEFYFEHTIAADCLALKGEPMSRRVVLDFGEGGSVNRREDVRQVARAGQRTRSLDLSFVCSGGGRLDADLGVESAML